MAKEGTVLGHLPTNKQVNIVKWAMMLKFYHDEGGPDTLSIMIKELARESNQAEMQVGVVHKSRDILQEGCYFYMIPSDPDEETGDGSGSGGNSGESGNSDSSGSQKKRSLKHSIVILESGRTILLYRLLRKSDGPDIEKLMLRLTVEG